MAIVLINVEVLGVIVHEPKFPTVVQAMPRFGEYIEDEHGGQWQVVKVIHPHTYDKPVRVYVQGR